MSDTPIDQQPTTLPVTITFAEQHNLRRLAVAESAPGAAVEATDIAARAVREYLDAQAKTLRTLGDQDAADELARVMGVHTRGEVA